MEVKMEEKILDSLEQIKEMMAQEYTISKHSILNDSYIKDQFILAVKENSRLNEFDVTIQILLEINQAIRQNGFLYIAKLKHKLNNVIFMHMASLLEKCTNLLRITALLQPAFYYMKDSELIESVLIHDGVQMCVLGYTDDEMKILLNNMLGGFFNYNSTFK